MAFYDYLVDLDKRCTNPFWIYKGVTNENIVIRCPELRSDCLMKEICELKMLGVARTDVESSVIDWHLLTDIRYTCLVWVYDLQQSQARITDGY